MPNFPRIFGELRDLPPQGGRDATLRAESNSASLAFTMRGQEQNNWCWAAVGTSIGDFYSERQTEQCAFASDVLGLPAGACCGTSSGGRCDKPWYLDRALAAAGCFERLDGVAGFGDVRGEVDAGQPLGVRVQWAQGGGHFMTIAGYRTGGSGQRIVTVHDPWGPKVLDLAIEGLDGGYGTDRGRWTHSYYTAAAPVLGGAPADRAHENPDLLGG